MNYESARFLELDSRDSDLQSLPDAPNSSHGNVPMLLCAGIVFLFFVLLVVHLVGLHYR